MPVGIPVTVVMPVVAPIMKIENCRRFGANVIIHGANIGESRERALLIGKDKDYMYINGFDHPNILVITKCFICSKSFKLFLSNITVWKFQEFSVSQILREINFGESRSVETAIFAIFGALNSVDLVNCSIQKVQK